MPKVCGVPIPAANSPPAGRTWVAAPLVTRTCPVSTKNVSWLRRHRLDPRRRRPHGLRRRRHPGLDGPGADHSSPGPIHPRPTHGRRSRSAGVNHVHPAPLPPGSTSAFHLRDNRSAPAATGRHSLTGCSPTRCEVAVGMDHRWRPDRWGGGRAGLVEMVMQPALRHSVLGEPTPVPPPPVGDRVTFAQSRAGGGPARSAPSCGSWLEAALTG